MTEETPFELLCRANRAELGIAVETDDPERLKQRLYAEIRKDPDFSHFSLLTSKTAPASEIWIVKKGQPNVEE